MQSEEKLIRLLIVDEGFHKAEQITSSLRAKGMQVRAEFAEDRDDLNDILANKSLDLVLFSTDLPDFTITEAQQLIRECGRHMSLIAMTRKLESDRLVNMIEQGAQDVVAAENLAHMVQVIKREAYYINLWRNAMRLDLDFRESEERCQALLANSRDAVAYIHEGMHIYANDAYMELFGVVDFD